MARMEKDYVLIKNKIPSKKGKKKDFIYYYRLKGETRGKKHSTGFDIERKAIEFVENIIAEKEEQKQLEKKYENNKARLTFPTFYNFAKDFFDDERCLYLQWLRDDKQKKLNPVYVENQRRYLINYILNADFVNKEWDKIQNMDILDFITQLKLPKNKTVRNEGKLKGFGVSDDKSHRIKKLLTLIFNRAIFVEIIDRSPIKRSSGNLMSTNISRERDIFSVEEVQHIFEGKWFEKQYFDNHMWKTFFLVLATTGMRIGEVRALRWKNLLLNENIVLVVNAFKTRKNDVTDENYGLPKWDKKRSTVLPTTTVQQLAEWKWESKYSKKLDFVFCYEDGTPLKYDTCLRKFKKMIKRTGFIKKDEELVEIGEIEKVRIFEPHCFRHSFNTHLLSSNVSDSLVQKMVGHESNSMTQNYLHSDKNILTDIQKSNQFNIYFKDFVKGINPETAEDFKLIETAVHSFYNFSSTFNQLLIKTGDSEALAEFEKLRTRIVKMMEKYT